VTVGDEPHRPAPPDPGECATGRDHRLGRHTVEEMCGATDDVALDEGDLRSSVARHGRSRCSPQGRRRDHESSSHGRHATAPSLDRCPSTATTPSWIAVISRRSAPPALHRPRRHHDPQRARALPVLSGSRGPYPARDLPDRHRRARHRRMDGTGGANLYPIAVETRRPAMRPCARGDRPSPDHDAGLPGWPRTRPSRASW